MYCYKYRHRRFGSDAKRLIISPFAISYSWPFSLSFFLSFPIKYHSHQGGNDPSRVIEDVQPGYGEPHHGLEP